MNNGVFQQKKEKIERLNLTVQSENQLLFSRSPTPIRKHSFAHRKKKVNFTQRTLFLSSELINAVMDGFDCFHQGSDRRPRRRPRGFARSLARSWIFFVGCYGADLFESRRQQSHLLSRALCSPRPRRVSWIFAYTHKETLISRFMESK